MKFLFFLQSLRNISVYSDVDYLDTYRAMENLVDLGLVKSIGVSNFNSEQVDRIVNEARIQPVCNQVECSPALNQKHLTAFCKERNVIVVAYSPLSQVNPTKNLPSYLYSDELKEIADRHNRTPAQIVLRFLVNKFYSHFLLQRTKKRLFFFV